MPRRSVECELSRERILEQARELFAKHGYHSLTMRIIAKEMGYSHGALYYHFKDKAELFYALVQQDFAKLLRMQREMIEKTKLGDLTHLKLMMLEFVKFGLDNPHQYEIMFMINDPDLKLFSRTEQAKSLGMFAAIVRAVVSEHPNGRHNLYMLPWSLFMSLHGFISFSIQFKMTFEEVKLFAEEHINSLCNGIFCD